MKRPNGPPRTRRSRGTTAAPISRKALTQDEAGLRHGWRSGLEQSIAEQLSKAGVVYEYEQKKLTYVPPIKARTYCPDFELFLPSGRSFFVETKGWWKREDRLRMEHVLAQHPDKDIRFVFQNANARISKTSRTRYRDWCDQRGVKWAHRWVPEEWLRE